MTEPNTPFDRDEVPENLDDLVEYIWRHQLQPESADEFRAELVFQRFPQLASSIEHKIDVVVNEYAIERDNIDAASEDLEELQSDFLDRFPELKDNLSRNFKLFDSFGPAFAPQPVGGIALGQARQPREDSVPGFSGGVSNLPDSRFEVVKELGRGATAVVYEAIDRQLGSRVAIKQLHAGIGESTRVRRRLFREARAVAKLHHPGIVPFREITQTANGWGLVSTLILGTDLERRIATQGCTEEEAVEWSIQVADALNYAHENGVIHRDVKPSNVLIDENNKALLADFGLAFDITGMTRLTQTGDVVGTPAFMAPEMLETSCDASDPRSDLYSLGALMYFLFTKRVPFEGSFSSVIHQLTSVPPKPMKSFVPGIPTDLETIVLKCLCKDKSGRYQSGRSVSEDLRRFQAGDDILARPVTRVQKLVGFARKRPLLSSVSLIAILSAAFGTGALFQLSAVVAQRNRAVVAEKRNQELLSEASNDAGLLAMQQGRLVNAIEHFESSLANNGGADFLTQLNLVECCLATGAVDRAKQYWDSAAQLETELTTAEKNLLAYWRLELEANGCEMERSNPGELELRLLPPAKREFLRGLRATNSRESLAAFQAAVEHDRYHHSARKMALVLGLSLAEFETVINESRISQQLFPEDQDFQLFESLAIAALGDVEAAEAKIDKIGLAAHRQEWIEFCKFLYVVTHESHPETGIHTTNLDTVSGLLKEFFDRFLFLVQERRWRFPRKIGEHFAQLPNLIEANELAQIRLVSFDLAGIHQEGTLLLIAGDNSIDESNATEKLERARDYFSEASNVNAFIQDCEQTALLSLYTSAVSLVFLKQHEVDANIQTYVTAGKRLDEKRLNSTKYLSTIVRTMLRAEEWEAAKRFSNRWLELATDTPTRIDAMWHLAISNKQMKDYVAVLEICSMAEALLEPGTPAGQVDNWRGLRDHARKELRRLIESQASEPEKKDD